MLLKNKRALITGGSRGIGKAVGMAFLKEGARVMLSARSREELEATKREFTEYVGEVYVYPADVSLIGEVKSLVEKAVETLGGIDILINAAGIYGPIGPSISVDLNYWKKTFEINTFGTFQMFREVTPVMIKQKKGKIINFSGGGDGPLPNFSAYSSSKAAIVRLTETLAGEVKDWNIDVNSIAPGAVNTFLLDEAIAAGEGKVGKERYQILLKQKEGGGVPPANAAELCVFLASDASDGLTGKFLSAAWDDWKKWTKKDVKEIMRSDRLTLRRIR